MSNETQPAEQVRALPVSGGMRLGGVLWLLAGVVCAGLLLVVFVGENRLADDAGLAALVLGGAIAALVTGALLLARPSPAVVRWSTILGLAWLLAFGSLALSAYSGPEIGPMISSSLITAFGVASGLVTYLAGRATRRIA